MNLNHILLGISRLLWQSVVVLLNPVLDQPCLPESSQGPVGGGGVSVCGQIVDTAGVTAGPSSWSDAGSCGDPRTRVDDGPGGHPQQLRQPRHLVLQHMILVRELRGRQPVARVLAIRPPLPLALPGNLWWSQRLISGSGE